MAAKETAIATTESAVPEKVTVAFNLMGDYKKSSQIQGLETLDSSDFKLAKFRLMQPTSIEVTSGKAKGGQFLNTMTGEYVDSISFVPLRLTKSRVKWPESFRRGDQPDCRSIDAITSVDGKIACKTCPHSSWDNKGEKNSKPACNLSYVFLGLLPEDDGSVVPFRLTAPGASVKYVKDFINVVVPRGIDLHGWTVKITSEFQSNDKGAFYIMKETVVGSAQDDAILALGLNVAELSADNIPAVKAKLAEIMMQREDAAKALKSIFEKAVDADLHEVAGDDGEVKEAGGLF